MSKYLQGRYTPKHPEKYEGDPTQIVYRSSWELKFANWCDTSPSVVSWSSEETVVPYQCQTDMKQHKYFLDAKITVRTRDNQIKTYLIEIKPDKETRPPTPSKRKTKRFLQEVLTWGKNESKWKAATAYAKSRGWEFTILTEYDLGLKKRS